uniref:DNA-directed RNA polymerase n=1 Tax=Rhipiliopsis peltata TaxID=2320810 RepID=A0A386B174_9CHLO|nr:RNA polymerase b-subunit [Rhipiliopsis peltata]AYC65437.1 RNA polymerase b-subunit [Rhipiliopsis peltata]
MTRTIFFNHCFDKPRFQCFLIWFFKKNRQIRLLKFLEKLKFLGFHSATEAGFSISIDDLKIPSSKSGIFLTAENQVLDTDLQFYAGNLTIIERYLRIIEIWNRTSEKLKYQVLQSFQISDFLNPVYLMAFSGARGNISQIRQLSGMRGLMADPQGQIIDFPIRSNFREGLTLTEYLISCSGARKGIVDTALRTAASGYLTRRLVDVAHHVIISQIDCGINKGIFFEDLYDKKKKVLPLNQRLIGRTLAETIIDSKTNRIVGTNNQEISKIISQKICQYRQKVLIRSPLTCQSSKFICQLCYGWNLAEGQFVSIGEAVGVLAAQSIGEPGTQLTMRTFHTGGVFTGTLIDQTYSPFSGIINYKSPCSGFLIRTKQGQIAYLSKNSINLNITSEHAKLSPFHSRFNKWGTFSPLQLIKFVFQNSTLLYVRQSEHVLKAQLIAELPFFDFGEVSHFKNIFQFEQEILSPFSGEIYFEDLLLLEKTTFDFKNAMIQGLGEFWILFGKSLNLYRSSFFRKQDLVIGHVPFSQIAIEPHIFDSYSKVMTSSQIFFLFFKKIGYFQVEQSLQSLKMILPSFHICQKVAMTELRQDQFFKLYEARSVRRVKKAIAARPSGRPGDLLAGARRSRKRLSQLCSSSPSIKQIFRICYFDKIFFSDGSFPFKLTLISGLATTGANQICEKSYLCEALPFAKLRQNFVVSFNRQGYFKQKFLSSWKRNQSCLNFCGNCQSKAPPNSMWKQLWIFQNSSKILVRQKRNPKLTIIHWKELTSQKYFFLINFLKNLIFKKINFSNNGLIRGDLAEQSATGTPRFSMGCGDGCKRIGFYSYIRIFLYISSKNLIELRPCYQKVRERSALSAYEHMATASGEPEGDFLAHRASATFWPRRSPFLAVGQWKRKLCFSLFFTKSFRVQRRPSSEAPLKFENMRLNLPILQFKKNFQNMVDIGSNFQKWEFLSDSFCLSRQNVGQFPPKYLIKLNDWNFYYNSYILLFRNFPIFLKNKKTRFMQTLPKQPISKVFYEVETELFVQCETPPNWDKLPQGQTHLTSGNLGLLVPKKFKNYLTHYLTRDFGLVHARSSRRFPLLGDLLAGFKGGASQGQPFNLLTSLRSPAQHSSSQKIFQIIKKNFYKSSENQIFVRFFISFPTKSEIMFVNKKFFFTSISDFFGYALPRSKGKRSSKLRQPFGTSQKVARYSSPHQVAANALWLAHLPTTKLGSFIGNASFDAELRSGQLIAKTQTGGQLPIPSFLFRKGIIYLLNNQSILHVKHGEIISKNQRLWSLFYSQFKTGDIVQGIPKIEEIFEARQKGEASLAQPEGRQIAQKGFRIARRGDLLGEPKPADMLSGRGTPARMSGGQTHLQNLQKSVINNIQRIYCGQGIHISDKHIEIIVRQMTSNVLIIEPGPTGLLCGEIVAFQWISRINKKLKKKQKIIYEPILMGMTKTCLGAAGFISAASFQETTRILSRAALQNQMDFLRGLKQNIILGNLIPIGTGVFACF